VDDSDAVEVAPSALDGDRIEFRRVQLHEREPAVHAKRHGARSAAQVDDDRIHRAVEERDGLLDEEPGSATRHEDARLDHDTKAAELRPAEYLLQRLAGKASRQQGLEILGRGRDLDEERCLVVRENTAARP
jgi:hypothetical protein